MRRKSKSRNECFSVIKFHLKIANALFRVCFCFQLREESLFHEDRHHLDLGRDSMSTTLKSPGKMSQSLQVLNFSDTYLTKPTFTKTFFTLESSALFSGEVIILSKMSSIFNIPEPYYFFYSSTPQSRTMVLELTLERVIFIPEVFLKAVDSSTNPQWERECRLSWTKTA